MAAIQVQFYNFNKRENSTAIPPITPPPASFNGSFRTPASIVSPVLDMDFRNWSNNVYDFNYCYIPYFNRYYFVRDWIFADGVWSVHLDIDPLASFRTDIGIYSPYILRASARYNSALVDDYYPAEATARTDHYEFPQKIFYPDLNQGLYVLSTTSTGKDNAVSPDGLHYYLLNYGVLRQFISALYQSGVYYSGIDPAEISENLVKCLMSPMQYVHSLKWYPNQLVPTGTSQATSFMFGFWELPFSGGNIQEFAGTNCITESSVDITLGRHPQAGSDRTYLNGPPYTFYKLHMPPFGDIEIDHPCLMVNNKITCTIVVDYITGDGILWVYGYDINGDKMPIGRYNAKVAIDIPIAIVNSSFPDNPIAYLAGDLMTKIPGMSRVLDQTGVANASNMIGSVLMTQNMTLSVLGSPSTAAAYNEPPSVDGVYYLQANGNRSEFGQPLGESAQIASLPGFVICQNASISISGTSTERTMINRYLNNGFYYE